MKMKFLFLNMLVLSFFFIILNHPISMGMVLLIQTLMVSMLTLIMFKNSWFSYMIFLILVGGMLVLFMYMTSVASNEKFKLNFSVSLMIMIVALISFLLLNLKLEFFTNSKFDFMLTLSKFIQPMSMMILLFLMIYLLVCMIGIVKISFINQGPLRQLFN
uniref:NADH-ubiquinone oxidoreductase chain 6 n=1 Tax=Chrysolagria sp. CHR01 TaxID=1205615 RepID=A0A0S2MP94_9CUCU|nr:NADH deshydrogenase subunit 6 [Chrysolagria sp. CHR01]